MIENINTAINIGNIVSDDHIYSKYINMFSFYIEVFIDFSRECTRIILVVDNDNKHFSTNIPAYRIKDIIKKHIDVLKDILVQIKIPTIKLKKLYENLLQNIVYIVNIYRDNQEKTRAILTLLQPIGEHLQEKLCPYNQFATYKEEVNQFLIECMAAAKITEMQEALQVKNQIKEKDNIIERQENIINAQVLLMERLQLELQRANARANKLEKEIEKKDKIIEEKDEISKEYEKETNRLNKILDKLKEENVRFNKEIKENNK